MKGPPIMMTNRIKNKMSTKNKTLHEVFVSSTGAIDLASIMVGIIVIGLIGGVIAATVFAIIPWAQDNAAKQQLDSIATAEQAYIGLNVTASVGVSSTPEPAFIAGAALATNLVSFFTPTSTTVLAGEGVVRPVYGSLQQLSDKKLFSPSSGVGISGFWDKDFTMCANDVSAGGGVFQAAVVSASGNTFTITSDAMNPKKAVIGDSTCLGVIQENGKPALVNSHNEGTSPATPPTGGEPATPPAGGEPSSWDCNTKVMGYGVYSESIISCDWLQGAQWNDSFPNPADRTAANCAAAAEQGWNGRGFPWYGDIETQKKGFIDVCMTNGWIDQYNDLNATIELGYTGAYGGDPSFTPIYVN